LCESGSSLLCYGLL
nr:immunoglobulin heavy chain junction region [Mus musculus]